MTEPAPTVIIEGGKSAREVPYTDLTNQLLKQLARAGDQSAWDQIASRIATYAKQGRYGPIPDEQEQEKPKQPQPAPEPGVELNAD